MKQANSFSSLRLFMPLSVLLCLFPTPSRGQGISFVGPLYGVNFGSVNLCKSGETAPAPCSKTIALDYKVTASGLLGTPKVLTSGSPNLDFTLAAGSTCIGMVTSGSTCTVNVRFSPKFPGSRPGGVLVIDSGGKALATTLLVGGAVGPQIGFNPGIRRKLHDFSNEGEFNPPARLTLDGAGDVFVPIVGLPLVELPAGGGVPVTISTGTATQPDDVFIDGAGNMFVHDLNTSYLVKIPAGGGPEVVLLDSNYGSISETGMAAKLNGDFYLALSEDYDGIYTYLLQFPAAGGGPNELQLPDPLQYINSFAIGGGDELYLYYGNKPIKIPADGGDPITLPFTVKPYGNEQANVLVINGAGDLLIQDQELTPGAKETITVPSSVNTSRFHALKVDAAGNFYYLGGNSDLTVYELLRSQLPALDFGSVLVGGTKTLPLQFTNTGNETLSVVPSFVSQSYKISGSTPTNCLEGIAAGRTCTLSVEFAPTKVGPHSIELTLKTNGAADTVTLLKGSGTE